MLSFRKFFQIFFKIYFQVHFFLKNLFTLKNWEKNFLDCKFQMEIFKKVFDSFSISTWKIILSSNIEKTKKILDCKKKIWIF